MMGELCRYVDGGPVLHVIDIDRAGNLLVRACDGPPMFVRTVPRIMLRRLAVN